MYLELVNSELRVFVRTILEAARTAGDAEKEGLALYIDSSGGKYDVLLYSPERAAAATKIVKKGAKSRNKAPIKNSVVDAITASAVGTISLRKPRNGNTNGAMEVVSSAAEGGFGPLLYDIAMSLAGSITSDREIVSSDARAVWSYYFSRRRDVSHAHIDNIDDPKTPPTDDDGDVYEPEIVHNTDVNPLNYTYSGGKAPDTGNQIKRHMSFVRELAVECGKSGITMDFAAAAFKIATSRYFSNIHGSRSEYDHD